MTEAGLTKAEVKHIDDLVEHYVKNRPQFERIISSLDAFAEQSTELHGLVHSYKRRTKDPEHLREKLGRKILDAKADGKTVNYTLDNLFVEINDLAGFRIIHLHTRQIEKIDKILQEFFKDELWTLKEGPTAKTWDDEARKYFTDLGFKIDKSENMYTSVHYVVQPNKRNQLTCEIQVRTLMEEVWGEVDHTINYPKKSKVLTCREQIKVLARMTSSCSRLVDSIFLSSLTAEAEHAQAHAAAPSSPSVTGVAAEPEAAPVASQFDAVQHIGAASKAAKAAARPIAKKEGKVIAPKRPTAQAKASNPPQKKR